jgi:hypothetical protein
MKLCFSIVMISRTISGTETLPQKITWLIHTSAPMLIPSFAYLAMNLLSFVALRHIDAGLFTVFAQVCELAAVENRPRVSQTPIKLKRTPPLPAARPSAPCRRKF